MPNQVQCQHQGPSPQTRDEGLGARDISRILTRDHQIGRGGQTVRLFLPRIKPGAVSIGGASAIARALVIRTVCLDDSRAVRGEQLPAIARGDIARAFDDNQVRKWPNHAVTSSTNGEKAVTDW